MFLVLGLLLVIAGSVVAIGAHFWNILDAFQFNPVWGLCSLSAPGYLVYVVFQWKRTRRSCLAELGGIAAIFVGRWLTALDV